MYSFSVTFFFVLLFYTSALAQPQKIPIKHLDSFYTIEQKNLHPQLNCLVLADNKTYDAWFKMMPPSFRPDFSKYLMLVITYPLQQRDMILAFEKISYQAGDFIEVYVSEKRGGKVRYNVYPLAVCLVPKYDIIKQLRFYYHHNLRLIESVPINLTKRN